MNPIRILLSHISEEATTAAALKESLENALPGSKVFVSSIDVRLGSDWQEALNAALRGARAMLVLCSRKSIGRAWLNFEGGFGSGRKLPVIPVCHGGIRPTDIPLPLGRLQGSDLRDPNDCEHLVRRLAEIGNLTPVSDFNADGFAANFTRPDVVGRQHQIGIMLAHGQEGWPRDGQPTLFDPAMASLPTRAAGNRFLRLYGEKQFTGSVRADLSGLIVGSPFRSRLSPEFITEVQDWVRKGGRMLLLGYELGDRHHNANLGELAQCFGIHPMPDIIGPPNAGTQKPYGKPVLFLPAEAEDHPLTRGLGPIVLRNVQTAMLQPGAIAWLRVGKNALYRPARESVQYQADGTFSTPSGAKFDIVAQSSWLPVAAAAPAQLCERGAVHFIGSWDLLRQPLPQFSEDDCPTLVSRLLDWLAGGITSDYGTNLQP